jgi:predicted enzyme related to lactoylglutathione lyase
MVNEIVHFEIPAKDPEKLSKFYKECFGWEFEDSGMTDMQYWLIKASTKRCSVPGGMYKKENARQTPVNYISTPNIDATITMVEREGGEVVVGKQEIPDMGWTAICKDPEGNLVGLWQTTTRRSRSARR